MHDHVGGIGHCVRAASVETCFPCVAAQRVGGVPENYLEVWVAQRYEVLWPHLFDPGGRQAPR